MAMRTLQDESGAGHGFHFLDKMLIACALAFIAVVGVSMCALPATAHGEAAWMMKYVNAAGLSCCDERDTAAIPNEIAAGAKIGSQIVAEFPTGPAVVTVNAIHATEDRQGRAMISVNGCLFKAFGG